MAENDREPVPLEEALRRIGPAERIHTFRDAGIALVGAYWERAELVDAMQRYGVEEAGEHASAFGHRLVLIDDVGPLFIEARGHDG